MIYSAALEGIVCAILLLSLHARSSGGASASDDDRSR
jgi:hypothetical protein